MGSRAFLKDVHVARISKNTRLENGPRWFRMGNKSFSYVSESNLNTDGHILEAVVSKIIMINEIVLRSQNYNR